MYVGWFFFSERYSHVCVQYFTSKIRLKWWTTHQNVYAHAHMHTYILCTLIFVVQVSNADMLVQHLCKNNMKIGSTSQNMDFDSRKGGRKTSSYTRHLYHYGLQLKLLAAQREKKKENPPERGGRRGGGTPSIVIKQRTVQVLGSKYVKQVSWLIWRGKRC